ncbi:ferrochelatase-domain-containing protein, partial [Pelagophyceae sp. CCMP2097]|mmetsp:Transcript_29278/g.101141  ORF Transcript_29278/g.101141 Transcript_29278/m.101141 type:complete len:464 (+) Transcript_29278:34-1425(+)
MLTRRRLARGAAAVWLAACCVSDALFAPAAPLWGGRTRRRAATLDLQQGTAVATPDAKKTKLKVAVMLLNLGGPEFSEDVEPFLYNLFADPDIIRLPPAVSGLQTGLAWLIAKRRAPKSREAYDAIGGGSPIKKYTTSQASLLEAALNSPGNKDLEYKCYVAMRYWHPFTDEALDRAAMDGCDCAVILPLYPHFSISTTGSSLRALLTEMQASHPRLMNWHTVVPSWHESPGYIKLVARLVAAELAALPPGSPGEPPPTVLFSAHGVPRSYIEQAGDPYKRHIEQTVALVTQRTREIQKDGADFKLAFQSRVGPVEWLKPYTDEMLLDIAASGVKRLVVVPISFVSEHIETLEEIDMEYRELAEGAGIEHWRRAPALNLDPEFIAELAGQVRAAVALPVVSTSEACVVNSFDLDEKPLGILPMIEDDVSQINGKTAAVGVAFGIFVELLTDNKLLHLFGLPAM